MESFKLSCSVALANAVASIPSWSSIILVSVVRRHFLGLKNRSQTRQKKVKKLYGPKRIMIT